MTTLRIPRRVVVVLKEEYLQFFVQNGLEAGVGYEITGGTLVVLLLLSIFRLVPTSEEQA